MEIIFVIIFGFCLGTVISLFAIVFLTRSVLKLKRQLEQAEKQIRDLQTKIKTLMVSEPSMSEDKIIKQPAIPHPIPPKAPSPFAPTEKIIPKKEQIFKPSPEKESSAKTEKTIPKKEPTFKPAPAQESSVTEFSLFEYLKNFFTSGNLMVRVGIIIIFFGVTFLIKYAAERHKFPVELRLISVVIGGLAMLIIGWRLRLKNTNYAIVLQGGAIGILYITIFASAKLYHLIPAGFAFVLMVALVLLSGMLAVLQDAKALAIFGSAGGFLAPVLTSTGGGSHVMLFSYYAILNAGILGIAWFKAWRELNLVGFFFTFGIGASWGHNYYQPDLFKTTEPFLILFFLFFVMIAILFAHRQPPQLKGYVDSSLVFGVPLVGFTMQSAMVQQYEYGMAISALSLSAFYIFLASLLWHRKITGIRLLTEAFLALGVVFGSLAIPLSLSGRWTASAWAMEGAAMIWIGVRQKRVLSRVFGILLQIGAGFTFLDSGVQSTLGKDIAVFNGLYLGSLVISLAALFSSFYLNRYKETLKTWEKHFHIPVLIWGLIWWFAAGIHEIDIHLSEKHEIHASLLFFALSCGAMGWISRNLKWNTISYPPIGLVPVMAFTAFVSYTGSIYHSHPFIRWGFFAWMPAFGVQYWLLWYLEENWNHEILRLWHIVSLWLLTFIMTWEFSWLIQYLVKGADTWGFIAWGIIPGFVILILLAWEQNKKSTDSLFSKFLTDYLNTGITGIFFFLCLWGFTGAFHDGNPIPLPYFPLINPLDIIQIFVLLVMIRWLWDRVQRSKSSDVQEVSVFSPRFFIYILVFITFLWLNAVVSRTVHFFGDIPFRWHSLYNSILFQASISVLWSSLALGIMVGATRKGSREVWFGGATLLGFAVAKLFLVDRDGIGTIACIVSFLAVGILTLIIGYFSPLPPAAVKHKQ